MKKKNIIALSYLGMIFIVFLIPTIRQSLISSFVFFLELLGGIFLLWRIRKEKVDPPKGIIIISIITIIISFLILAIMIEKSQHSLDRLYSYSLSSSSVVHIVINGLAYFHRESLGIGIPVVHIVSGIGMIFGKDWARRLFIEVGIIFYSFFIAAGMMFIFTTTGMLFISKTETLGIFKALFGMLFVSIWYIPCLVYLKKPTVLVYFEQKKSIAYDNGIVYDSKTNREWFVGPDKDTTWDEAKEWVDNLTVDGGGWQMPTRKELRRLYDVGKGERNMSSLLKTTGWLVWSSKIKGSSAAWLFDLEFGCAGYRYRNFSSTCRAFAVRSRSR